MEKQVPSCDILLTDTRYLAPDMTVVSGKTIAIGHGRILDIASLTAISTPASSCCVGDCWMKSP